MTQRIATAADWQNQSLPELHLTLALDFRLDTSESGSMRQGFIPVEMEDKWFFYCADDTLYMHRSWTGYCIAQVHFVAGGDGLRVVSAEVNRDPAQYANSDDQADVELIERVVRSIPFEHKYRAEMREREAAWLAGRANKTKSAD